ncbi:anhydro-N-acetylmuramic acid kinase [Thioalkalivibrio sp. HK1]|uniref:anhydro-N-acetylmuramic acid kinase n=1 Tax=Thioalkalivibrio sp. HK1 TaxID=1469245 RepID=UPI000470FED1|nr:anhydro-N-acetylmuramic acid kinase [Thioalkalivibrio sp. HK1]
MLFIGLISGTSVDAVDAALVDFDEERIRLVSTSSTPIPDSLRHELHALAQSPDLPAHRFWKADVQIGGLFADAVQALIASAGVEAQDISAIGSHGQTVWHAPCEPYPFTVQIGDANIIAERTGITTVCDFRRRDIAAGGEGAPLAPAFHRAAFFEESIERGILNLGGIANLSVVGSKSPPLGFDTGPGNTLLDAFVREHFGRPMDRDAELARTGNTITSLLDALLLDAYFDRPPPKSTGREYFNSTWLSHRIGNRGDMAQRSRDILRTLCELTVESVAKAIERFAPHIEEVYLCGGGAQNPLLTEGLAKRLPRLRIETTERLGIHPEWVEAVAFAWLAMRTLAGKSGNAPDMTGAKGERILGGIYRA